MQTSEGGIRMQQNTDQNNLPRHIAVIMDGNGRWAKSRGASRIFGHKNAIKAVRETTEFCAEKGIGFLTLYAFSHTLITSFASPKRLPYQQTISQCSGRISNS